jgi:thiamine pyrophosphate-dependent acetolactate synthase large subunit-like protein
MTSSKPKVAQTAAANDPLAALERPVPARTNAAGFGSDVAAETLRALDVPYIALNPGASYRGLHDSLVNHLGNRQPQMLLCLHEESAVAIAHGYAKVTGRAMAAAVHSNVGLFHATMAIFNAWCDRMPVIVIGATGPVDAAKRRPWIDWIHTARDQGALVRGYVKWDDQPASPAATREALLRAGWIAQTAPMGPVYVNLDAGMQEAALDGPLPDVDATRFMPAAPLAPPPAAIEQAAAALRAARRPVILAGRASRCLAAWEARVALAEAISARVVTDLKIGAAFPTDHPLHAGTPGIIAPAGDGAAAIRNADVILSLDWVDLAGTLRGVFGNEPPPARIIQVTLDHLLHNGWSMDYQGLPPVDLLLAAEPDAVMPALLAALGAVAAPDGAKPPAPLPNPVTGNRAIAVDDLAAALRRAAGPRAVSLTHLPLGWNGATWPFRHPLDYIGS